MNNKYKIVAIMGESGSGKDTLQRHLCHEYPTIFNSIVSHTTRPPRDGEINGMDYYFTTPEAFAELIINEKMLEATCFNDWHYGTSIDVLDKKKYNIGVFNPEGVSIIVEDPRVDLLIIYLTCDDKERLIRQLNREQNPNVEEIIRRFSTDKSDFQAFKNDFLYHYNVLNSGFLSPDELVEYVVTDILHWSLEDK